MPGTTSKKHHDTDEISSNMTPNTNLSDFLKHLRKTAKQAFDSKPNDYVKAFPFDKLPVAIQNDLSTAGKQDTRVDKNREFIQRRYQYQQLMETQQPLHFNEFSSGREKRQNDRPTRDNQDQQRQIRETCCHCNKKGHKSFDCRTRKWKLAQNFPQNDNQLLFLK